MHYQGARCFEDLPRQRTIRSKDISARNWELNFTNEHSTFSYLTSQSRDRFLARPNFCSTLRCTSDVSGGTTSSAGGNGGGGGDQLDPSSGSGRSASTRGQVGNKIQQEIQLAYRVMQKIPAWLNFPPCYCSLICSANGRLISRNRSYFTKWSRPFCTCTILYAQSVSKLNIAGMATLSWVRLQRVLLIDGKVNVLLNFLQRRRRMNTTTTTITTATTPNKMTRRNRITTTILDQRRRTRGQCANCTP